MMNKKIAVVIVAIFFILLLLFIVIAGFMGFFPNTRNYSETDTSVRIEIPKDRREPIINTYDKVAFEKLSDAEKSELQNHVDGSLEGDRPYVDPSQATNILVRFETSNDAKPIRVENPQVEVTVYERHGFAPANPTDPATFTVKIPLKPDRDGKYRLDISPAIAKLKEKEAPNTAFYTITYRYNGKEYVSYTATSISPEVTDNHM